MSIIAGALLVGNNAYAWQELLTAEVVAIGCFTSTDEDINDCYFVIDRDHDQTTATASCKTRYFAFDPETNKRLYDVAQTAYTGNKKVLIRYSEYACYPTWWGDFMRAIQVEAR